MASLASGFHIFFGEQRPEPMFVVAMGLLDACSGATVALVAWRTAKFVRIMRLQKFRFGMTRKCAGVLVRFFPRWRHRRCSQFYWLANPQVARLATVHDVCFGYVDLHNLCLPSFRLIL